MNRLRMLLHEQHRGDDDVRLGDDGEAALQGGGIVPFRGGMKCEVEPGNLDAARVAARAIHGARQMVVERDDDDIAGRAVQRPKWALAS